MREHDASNTRQGRHSIPYLTLLLLPYISFLLPWCLVSSLYFVLWRSTPLVHSERLSCFVRFSLHCLASHATPCSLRRVCVRRQATLPSVRSRRHTLVHPSFTLRTSAPREHRPALLHSQLAALCAPCVTPSSHTVLTFDCLRSLQQSRSLAHASGVGCLQRLILSNSKSVWKEVGAFAATVAAKIPARVQVCEFEAAQ
jgi:hypothetical protein